MVNNSETPFESIESTHEYVGFIVEAVEEAKASIMEDLDRHQQAQTGGMMRSGSFTTSSISFRDICSTAVAFSTTFERFADCS